MSWWDRMPWSLFSECWASIGLFKITEVTLKANRLESWTARGMVKNQSCRSITITLFWKGTVTRQGRPVWRAPMSSIVAFIALKSCNNQHFPHFFLITKIRLFHRLLEGSIWPPASCSITKSSAACNFLAVKGHCSIHTGSSNFQVIGSAARATASRINLNIPDSLYSCWEPPWMAEQLPADLYQAPYQDYTSFAAFD